MWFVSDYGSLLCLLSLCEVFIIVCVCTFSDLLLDCVGLWLFVAFRFCCFLLVCFELFT